MFTLTLRVLCKNTGRRGGKLKSPYYGGHGKPHSRFYYHKRHGKICPYPLY